MPKYPDLEIFVVKNKLTNRWTEPIALPLAHAHGVTTTSGQCLLYA